jgi:phosphoribosylformylglycinamidine synthase
MVGLVNDLTKIAGQAWQSEGDRIYLLGIPTHSPLPLTLGASEYLATLHQTIAGLPPIVDFDLERRVQTACRTGIQQGWVRSAHDCSEGGLSVALAECCIAANKGADIQVTYTDAVRWDHLLFAEGGARIIVSIAPDQTQAWEDYLNQHLNGFWQAIGQVSQTGGSLCLTTANNLENSLELVNLSVEQISDRWNRAIERRLEQD